MSLLNVYKLEKLYNIYPIFQEVSFQVNPGEKVALVGMNGAGKTTLLRIIAGEEDYNGGTIALTRGLRVVYLPQEAKFESTRTLHDEMLTAFSSLLAMQKELQQLADRLADVNAPDYEVLLAEYSDLSHRFEVAGGYDYERRIDQVLTGLGFIAEDFTRNIHDFSGGQKTRAALARSLLLDPDLLLLDEPTNHLDLTALNWLEDFITKWQGTLIVISHDRYFLDRTTTRTLDMAFGTLEDYPGGYTKYLQLKAERMERRLAEFEAQQVYISKTEDFIRRYKAGQRYRQARGRQKQLNRLDRVSAPQEHDKLKLNFRAHLRAGRAVLAFEDLVVGLPPSTNGDAGRPLFRLPDLELERGQKIALIGANGCGKSTFLKSIMGETPPLQGEIEYGPNVKIAYYAQSHEGLNPERDILDEIRDLKPMVEEEARNFLGRFLFSGDDVYKKIGTLSGGERSRVALAKLTLTPSNLLILDEPTNHLDITAREALENVLAEYDGSILFVSHDRYFIDALATQVWTISNGELTVYLGNYTDYLETLARKRRDLENVEEQNNGARSPAQERERQKMLDRERNAAARRVKEHAARITALEEKIASLETELKKITLAINTAGAAQNLAEVTKLGTLYQTTQAKLDQTYEEWATMSESAEVVG